MTTDWIKADSQTNYWTTRGQHILKCETEVLCCMRQLEGNRFEKCETEVVFCTGQPKGNRVEKCETTDG